MTLQQFNDLPRALECAGASPETYKAVLEDCREFFTRYADLEETILGRVPIQFPVHLLEESLPSDPLQAAETVAEREHSRLDQGDIGLNGMHAFLDSRQLKVYRFDSREEGNLLGFFLFDAHWGPIFAVSRSLPRKETDRVLARLYGHFLMDNDPYEIQLVWRGWELSEPSQLRATAFAATFLIPRKGLQEYLAASGVEPGEMTTEILNQLSVYFGVDPASVALRLAALGWMDAPAMFRFAAAARPESSGEGRSDDSVFGSRFLLLALEAHARNVIDLKTLSEYLETTPADAALWKERFHLETSDPNE